MRYNLLDYCWSFDNTPTISCNSTLNLAELAQVEPPLFSSYCLFPVVGEVALAYDNGFAFAFVQWAFRLASPHLLLLLSEWIAKYLFLGLSLISTKLKLTSWALRALAS